MNKIEMTEAIASKNNLTKACAERILDQIAGIVEKEVSVEGTSLIPGIGTIVCKTQNERTCRNPQTGGTIKVPAKQVIRIRASKKLKDAVN